MYETYAELPEPTIRPYPKDYKGEPKREIETFWTLGETGEGTVRLSLSVRHDPGRKQFRSTLTWETLEVKERHPADGPGTYSVTTWSSDHYLYGVRNAPVARYSKKALEAEYVEAFAMVVDHWEEGFSHVAQQAVVMAGLDEEVQV